MHDLPPLELLEATHAFPGPFMFKVVGRNVDRFVGRVVSVVRSAIPSDVEPSFSTRCTQGGRHVCVTIEPVVDSAEQVLDLYARLRDLDDLVMLF